MGNAQSDTTQKKTLPEIIDYISANYILTQNFTDMEKLADMTYCDKLAILTSRVVDKNTSNLDIKYMTQRLKKGVEINEMREDKLLFFPKDQLNDLDVINKTQKRRLCIGIARFYVKIAYLFAAIVTTVNPTYKFKDSEGNVKEVDLSKKHEIPSDGKASVTQVNLCNQRLTALLNGESYLEEDLKGKSEIKVKPNFCGVNYDFTALKTKSLMVEPGLPELEKLYFDKYDYDNGGFVGMTKKMREEVYEKDVETFYKVFTGNDEIPIVNGVKSIKNFSQIQMHDYKKIDGCELDGKYTKAYTGSLKDKLFSKYAENIQRMLKKTKVTQEKLLNFIDQLFEFDINSQTNKPEIIIKKSLTESKLDVLAEEIRKTIIDLYINCEIDFSEGLKIFEAIVAKVVKDTVLVQDKNLETMKHELIVLPMPVKDTIHNVQQLQTDSSLSTSTHAEPASITHAEPAHAEQSHAEPAHAEPSHAEPSHAKPSHAEPAHAEPAHAEPAHAEPAHAEPSHAEPAHAEQSHAEQSHAEPSHAEPSHAEPAHAEPAHAEPAHAEPAHGGKRISRRRKLFLH